MPLRLMLLFVLITPLVGVVQMELGSWGASVGLWGSPNGAAWAFSGYALLVVSAAAITTRGTLFEPLRRAPVARRFDAAAAHRVATWALALELAFMLLTLYLFGGLDVLSGEVGKGEFRTTLGGLGAFAFLTLKWFAPSLFALACTVHLLAGTPPQNRKWLLAGGLATFVTGLAWGFKTSGLFVILPGMFVLLWSASLLRTMGYFALALAVMAASFALFDTLEGTVYGSVFEFLLARFTVFQGEVSWYLWDLWSSGATMPDYAVTLLAAIGDRLFSLLSGITREDSEAWILAHYGSLLTYTIGHPIEGIEGGHSVTGTPFSEGLVAGGLAGALLFGVLAGVIFGFVFRRLREALLRGRPVAIALWSNYSVWFLFAWLNSGEIVQLFHISVFFGAAVCWGMLHAVLHVAQPQRPQRPAAPAATLAPSAT
jgi:hypothetical protein